MVIRAYKVAADGAQSIVELEVSENWFPKQVELDDSTQVQLADDPQPVISAVKEVRTVAIISNKKSQLIGAAK